MTAHILPMHAGQPSDFGKLQPFAQKMDTTTGAVDHPASASPDRDEDRGRRRDRDDNDNDNDPDNNDPNDAHDGTGSSRKRRRSRKGLDKKFECPHSGCGKSYSRAEHLYRHQLNRMSHVPYLSLLSPTFLLAILSIPSADFRIPQYFMAQCWLSRK